MIGELFDNVELFDNQELARYFRLPQARNGTKALVLREGLSIVGQLEMSISFIGSVINVSNPSNDKFVKLKNNVLYGKQFKVSGSIIYNSSVIYNQIKIDSQSATPSNYTITYSTPSSRSEEFACLFVPKIGADAMTVGDKVTSTIELISSGTPTYSGLE